MGSNWKHYQSSVATSKQPQQPPNQRRLTIISFIAVVIIIIIAIIGYTVGRQTQQNPYGPEIYIHGFTKAYPQTPKDREEAIYAMLYSTSEKNVTDGTDLSNFRAELRNNTAESEYDESRNIHYGRFIVDLPQLKQSYQVTFEWSDSTTNPYLSGYSVVIKCPPSDQIIYEDFKCYDVFTAEEEQIETEQKDFPIIKNLPIDIDYFENGIYISYRISAQLNTDKDGKQDCVVFITDRSGNSREKALDRIRHLSCGNSTCNPNDYTIDYQDKSNYGGYAGNS